MDEVRRQLAPYLLDGEQLLWCGRADPAKHLTGMDAFLVPFSARAGHRRSTGSSTTSPSLASGAMADPHTSTAARRQALLERVCAALQPLLGPRLSVEAVGGKGVVVQLDQGSGGTLAARAAPWLPGLTVRRDLVRTAGNVARVLHGAVPEKWRDIAGIGPRSPSVDAVADVVAIRFFGSRGEPLLAVEVSLSGLA